MNTELIRQILKPLLWDYNIDPLELYAVALGKKKKVGSFTQQKALLRVFERLPWYDLIRLFTLDGIKNLLTPGLIAQIRYKTLQDKYEVTRKVLHGEAISFSGWNPEYREKIKHSLLSNRWYRSG